MATLAMSRLLTLCAVLGPCLAFLYNVIPPVHGSFRCSDPSISFPYTGDTVSTKLLLCGTIFPVLLLVLLKKLPGFLLRRLLQQ